MTQSRSGKVLVLSSGDALTTLVAIIAAAVLARAFSKLEYATYRQAMLAYTFAVPFVMLGFNRAPYYFLPVEKERARGVLVENLLLLGAGGLLLTLFIVCGGNHLLALRFHNPDLAPILMLLAPYPLVMIPAASLSGCLMARDRTAQVAVYNVASRVLMLLTVVLPCVLWPTVAVATMGTVAGGVVTGLIAFHLMFRACATGSWLPTAAGLRAQIAYSVPLGLAALVGSCERSLDKVIVAAMADAEAFAVYVNGAVEIPIYSMITGAATAVLSVEYRRLHAEGNVAEIIALVHRAMVKCALVILPCMFFLLAVAPEVMRVLYGGGYGDSATFFRIYLLLSPIRTLTFGAILVATGKGRYILVQAILTLAASAIATPLAVHYFGVMGAAISSVAVVYLVSVPYLVIVIAKVLECPRHGLLPWSRLLLVSAASSVGALALVAIRPLLPPLPDVVILCVTGVIYAGVTMVVFSYTELVGIGQMWTSMCDLLRGRA